MSHMLKEFMHFKKCEEDSFFIFIDDQDTDNFWRKLFQSGAYKKPGYLVNYISGNESRLKGHLGGFLRYTKEMKFVFAKEKKNEFDLSF